MWRGYVNIITLVPAPLRKIERENWREIKKHGLRDVSLIIAACLTHILKLPFSLTNV